MRKKLQYSPAPFGHYKTPLSFPNCRAESLIFWGSFHLRSESVLLAPALACQSRMNGLAVPYSAGLDVERIFAACSSCLKPSFAFKSAHMYLRSGTTSFDDVYSHCWAIWTTFVQCNSTMNIPGLFPLQMIRPSESGIGRAELASAFWQVLLTYKYVHVDVFRFSNVAHCSQSQANCVDICAALPPLIPCSDTCILHFGVGLRAASAGSIISNVYKCHASFSSRCSDNHRS